MTELITMLGFPFLGCLAIVAIVGYMGLHVLKREVVFIDIALAQMAAVGVIVPHLLFHAHHDSPLTFIFPLVFTTAAAAFYAFARSRVVQIPLEATIGVSYAIASGAALFLIGVQPGGHVHVKQMLIGSILWTTGSDVAWCAAVFSVVGLLFYLMRKPFTRISDDYEAAVRAGMKVVGWDFLFYALLGIVIILAVRIAGVVIVFCFLIIPATTSAIFSSKWRIRLLLTWLFGAVASLLGLVFAYCLDFSLGPSVALFSGLVLVVCGLASRRPRPALVALIGTSLLAFADLSLLATRPSGPQAAGAQPPSVSAPPPRQPASGKQAQPAALTDEEIANLVAKAADAATLDRLFGMATSPQLQVDIVSRAVSMDKRAGAALLIRFLKTDPPLFFRATALDALGEPTAEAAGFDPAQAFAAPVNQRAAAKLAELLGVRAGAPAQ